MPIIGQYALHTRQPQLRQPTQLRSQQGLSLIEIMIAIVIGLLATAAALQALVTSTQTQNMTNQIESLNEQGRFALWHLQADLRSAGDSGCPSWMTRNTNTTAIATLGQRYVSLVQTSSNSAAWFSHFYRGVEAVPATPKPDWLTDYTLDTQSDILIIHKIDNTVQTSLLNHTNKTLSFTQNPGFKTGDLALITTPDCRQSSQFLINSAATNHITVDKSAAGSAGFKNCDEYLRGQSVACSAGLDTSSPLDSFSTLSKIATTAYFVDLSQKTLMRWRAGEASASVFIEGVQGFNAQFGLDTSGDGIADQFFTTSQMAATAWPQVVTVRVSLVLEASASTTLGPTAANDLVCGARTFSKNNQMRNCFSAHITIRNRGGSPL